MDTTRRRREREYGQDWPLVKDAVIAMPNPLFSLYVVLRCPHCKILQTYANTWSNLIVCDYCCYTFDMNNPFANAYKSYHRGRQIPQYVDGKIVDGSGRFNYD